MTELYIPDSVTYISASAFSICIALTDVAIPDSVTNIGSSCFRSCSSLKYITIGKGVSQVGSGAFGDCSSLENVYISDLSKLTEKSAKKLCIFLFLSGFTNRFLCVRVEITVNRKVFVFLKAGADLFMRRNHLFH